MTENLSQGKVNCVNTPASPEGESGDVVQSRCGNHNTIVGVRTMLDSYPDRWGDEEKTGEIREWLDEAGSANLVAAVGCQGSEDPTSWEACPRRLLIEGMLNTARFHLGHREDSAGHTPPGQYL